MIGLRSGMGTIPIAYLPIRVALVMYDMTTDVRRSKSRTGEESIVADPWIVSRERQAQRLEDFPNLEHPVRANRSEMRR